MLRGLWQLTWLETKIFVREPLGLFGTFVPALAFVIFGSLFGSRISSGAPNIPRFIGIDLPIFTSLLIVVSTVLSLVAIIAIYREGGILKRLRATPLQPYTILTAHVLVKMFFTTITLAMMVLAGRRFYPVGAGVPLVSYTIALLFTTVSILSLGFLIASVVPTARFAQPIGSLVLYPMFAISGLFAPVAAMPPGLRLVARLLPTTYAVSLLRGIWHGDRWLAHAPDVAILAVMFLVFTALATRVFRWE